MNKIYNAFSFDQKNIEPENTSLVELLNREKSVYIFQADLNVDILKSIRNSRVGYDLQPIGLNLGFAHPHSRWLELTNKKEDIHSKKYPFYIINPWGKILFSNKDSLMRNRDWASEWFVYWGTREEALEEFINEGYKILPLETTSKEYQAYLRNPKEVENQKGLEKQKNLLEKIKLWISK